jgi:transposase
MKIRTSPTRVNHNRHLLVAADVSRDTLHLFSRFERPAIAGADAASVVIEDAIENRTRPIESALGKLADVAAAHGLMSVEVLCESSGGYERPLLRVARRLGMQTALVSPERVIDLKRVESLDTGKTDRKDTRVIHLAGELGKTQRHRDLPEHYERLRRLTSFHDDEVETITALKSRLLRTLNDAFPDYDRPSAFTWSKTGRALIREGLLDPYRIVSLGEARFGRMLKRRVLYAKYATIERLVEAATASVRSAPPEAITALATERMQQILVEIELHERARDAYRGQIEALGAELKAAGEMPAIDEVVEGISLFNLARVVGQTGPLEDFRTARQLLRYAGMNLRERESGTYRGKTRLSKKGRPLLRKVLGQAVFPITRRDRLMGPGYDERRKRMAEQKARVAAMRKLLVVIWAVQTKRQAFEPSRVFVCESRFKPRHRRAA